MGLFNYTQAKKMYKNDELMSLVLDGLEGMDQYHLLRGTSTLSSVKDEFPSTTEEFKRWLSVCDGGLLFSTTLLGIDDYDKDLDISLSTLKEWNTPQKYELLNLPQGYYIVALLNYGDPVCLSLSNTKVYLWDISEQAFTTVWESFADFLADEYNTAIQMIEDEALDPVPMKMEEQDGE